MMSKAVGGCALVLGLMLGASVEASAVTAQQPLINGSIDEAQLVTLPGNVHPDANARNDRGRVDDSTPLNHLQLVLVRPAGLEAELEDYIQAVQTPGNPNYHRWLTAEEIGTKYGPYSGDIAAVRSWLELHGFQVNSVSANGLTVDFSGTAGEVAETRDSQSGSEGRTAHGQYAEPADPGGAGAGGGRHLFSERLPAATHDCA